MKAGLMVLVSYGLGEPILTEKNGIKIHMNVTSCLNPGLFLA